MAKKNIAFNKYNSKKTTETFGILSFYRTSKKNNLQFVNSRDIIEYFRLNHKEQYAKITDNPLNYRRHNNDIEVILKSLYMYIDDKIDFSEDKKKNIKEEIKQELIDVMFFDCLLGNSDRSDENFGLLVGNDVCTLYPIFDNEYILGLYQYKSTLTLNDKTKKQYKQDQDKTTEYGSNITSRIGYPGNESQIYYGDLISYLSRKYPKESKNAWNKVSQITLSDIQDCINRCKSIDSEYYTNSKGKIVPYFDEVHERFALTLFDTRREKIQEIVQEQINEKETKVDDKINNEEDIEL